MCFGDGDGEKRNDIMEINILGSKHNDQSCHYNRRTSSPCQGKESNCSGVCSGQLDKYMLAMY